MADSVYISKNLDGEQLKFMQLLQGLELLYFDMQQIEGKINQHFENLNEVLENLVDKNMLVRIERGKYALPNYNNIHVLATFISKNSCIAYWSALYFYGLTERFPNIVFVKTTQRKRNTEIGGVPIQFITVKKEKNIGTIEQGYGEDSFSITDIEMTFVDCFDQLRYSGGFPDLIKAFATAQLTNKRLINYTQIYQNIALIKRLGFLAELFHPTKLKSFIKFAKRQVNNRYDVLEPGGLEEGVFVNKWKLRLNITKKDLFTMAESEY